jgi:hypothetical protein
MIRGCRLVTTFVLGVGLLVVARLVPHANSAQSPDMTSLAARQPLSPAGDGGGLIGETFPISFTSDVHEVRPAVAYNSQRQEYLVVWWNDRPNYDDIYGRRLTADGQLLPWFAIVWGTSVRRQPDVAYNAQADNYMVVYVEDWNIGGGIVPATGGQASTLPFDLTTAGTSSTVYYDQPSIAYDATSGIYLVAFRYVDESGTFGSKVEARGVFGDGNSVSPGVFTLDGFSTATRPGTPDVAYNAASDEFLVVWERWDGADRNVYGQRVEYDASIDEIELVNGPFPILVTAGDDYDPAVAAIPNGTDGQYLVACSNESTMTLEVLAQRVTGQGALEGDPIVVATGPGIKKGVDVAASESGGQYLVVWGKANALVQEQAVSPEGQLLGDMVEVYSPLTLAREPAVVDGPLSDFFVAFQDASADGYSYDIYGHLWGIRVYLPLVLKAT